MSADVIQHTKPRRKRGNARSWTARHFVLLVVVVAGIIAASWLAPEMVRSPPPAGVPEEIAEPAFPPITPDLAVVDAVADLAGPPRAAPARSGQAARHMGVPLDAAVSPMDEYEILSAAELDGISQARN